MARNPMNRHSNLGDHPGHTAHTRHHGQAVAAHGHRARGGAAGTSPGGTHRPNGRGLGISSADDDDYAEGGAVDNYARGGAHHDDDDDHDHDAYGGRVRLQRGGRGGSKKDRLMSGDTDSGLSDTGSRSHYTRSFQYNAVGSPTMSEANDRTPGFRRGGRKRGHHKDGGTAGGLTAAPRMDHARRQRGGSAGTAPGTRSGRGSTRTPYSSGSSLSSPANDKEGRGYEGGGPA